MMRYTLFLLILSVVMGCSQKKAENPEEQRLVQELNVYPQVSLELSAEGPWKIDTVSIDFILMMGEKINKTGRKLENVKIEEFKALKNGLNHDIENIKAGKSYKQLEMFTRYVDVLSTEVHQLGSDVMKTNQVGVVRISNHLDIFFDYFQAEE
ncbi:MAG: hypothetical protein OEX02_05640 [Cyclobacteriaceae bacterium]|nr:hypothetical protein [Cyclobacteriaceae bacterium]